MGSGARPERRPLVLGELCFARDAWLRRSRRQRHLAGRAGVWACLVSGECASRLGALQLWLLELGCSLGLDLDRLRSLGFHSFPLWTLGVRWRGLGLVPGTLLWSPDLWTGVRRFPRWGLGFWIRRWRGLVPAGLGRAILPLVPLQPRLHQCD